MRRSLLTALTWCTVIAAVLSAVLLALTEGDPLPRDSSGTPAAAAARR
jgi:hypothetical protein